MPAKKTTAKKATAKKATAKKATAKKATAKKAGAKRAAAPKASKTPAAKITKAASRARRLGAGLVAAGETMQVVADKAETLAERIKNRPRLLKRNKK